MGKGWHVRSQLRQVTSCGVSHDIMVSPGWPMASGSSALEQELTDAIIDALQDFGFPLDRLVVHIMADNNVLF